MGCIVAIVNLDGEPVHEPQLKRMMAVPPYDRTADGQVRIDGEAGFGFVPLRPDAEEARTPQPFGRCGSSWIVFDGRLDDRASLVSALKLSPDVDLESVSDVDLALRAYEEWGTDCAAHLLGDFAFCVWDAPRRQFLAARDQMGVRPLYYARVGRTLILSNTLRSIRQDPRVSSALRDDAVADLFLFGFNQDLSATIFADVSRLPPAHVLTCGQGTEPGIRKYWSLEPGTEIRYADSGQYIEHLQQLLSAAVGDRVREGAAGVAMSGGLDSCCVAAMASDGSPSTVRAYTVVYDRLMPDREREFSNDMAAWLGIPIEHIPVDDYELFDRWSGDTLPPEPWVEPLSAIMTDLLGRASAHVPVVLTGDGGDPLLVPSTVVNQIFRVPLGHLARDLWQSVWRFRLRPPLGLRSSAIAWLDRKQSGVPGWLAEPLLDSVDVHDRWERFRSPSVLDGTTRADARGAVLSPYWASTFEGQDPGVTQCAVDVRHPFFDLRVISFALGLPSFPWCVDKTILRLAMKDRLPDSIRSRPKAPLAGDPVTVRKRWSSNDALKILERAPGIDQYVDLRRFRSLVRSNLLFTDDEPGTAAAVCLALWLQGSNSARICL